MKNVKILIIVVIAVLTACSNSGNKTDNSEKLTKFLANFEILKLPFVSADVKQHKIIENEFLDILTDTAGGFNHNNPEGKLHFETEYYYFEKIQIENKNYHTIIVGEMPYVAVWGGMEGAYLETKLYTISAKGDIISVIPLAYYYEGKNMEMTASINENIEIVTKHDKIVTNYKIEQDGTITKVSETAEENEYTINEFIEESFKPETSVFDTRRFSMVNKGISEEQYMFVANEYKPDIDEYTYYKPVVFQTPNYTAILLTYNNDIHELADLLTVDKNGKIISIKEQIYYAGGNSEFIFNGSAEIELLEDNTIQLSCIQADIKKDLGDGPTTYTYYKIDKNGKLTETEEFQTEEFQSEENSIIAAYTSFNWDKFYYYTFTTESGKKYIFKEMPDGIDYKFVYQDANNPGGIEEPELLGKKFKIQFHSEKPDGENDGLVIDYFIVDKIKMIDN